MRTGLAFALGVLSVLCWQTSHESEALPSVSELESALQLGIGRPLPRLVQTQQGVFEALYEGASKSGAIYSPHLLLRPYRHP